MGDQLIRSSTVVPARGIVSEYPIFGALGYFTVVSEYLGTISTAVRFFVSRISGMYPCGLEPKARGMTTYTHMSHLGISPSFPGSSLFRRAAYQRGEEKGGKKEGNTARQWEKS